MNAIWLVLSNIKGLGIKGIHKIYTRFPDLNLADLHQQKTLQEIGKLVRNKKITETLSDFYLLKQLVKKAEESILFHKENQVKIIAINDKQYPEILKKIDNPPIVLYCKGNFGLLKSEKTIAIVGTRNPTVLGRKTARQIANLFADKGYVIVSGLAAGIDTEAHFGALEVTGKTIAVLAGGLDSIFPKENQPLAAKILDRDGLLLSEYPLHSPMYRAAFVQRDRIQSGLSAAVCPVQMAIKGGTNHTIAFARAQNRFLFTPVPKEDVPATQGILKILKEGVYPLKTREDIPVIETHIAQTLEKLFQRQLDFHEGPVSQLDLFD